VASAGDRYVATTAIREAVRGHEAAILAALGIDHRSGRPHIRCPYSDHDDGNASWRWVEQRARAFCSCIERSHGIFDVVMKMLALDFEGAKIRVAEVLGRNDLIKTKGAGGGQKVDSASLLSPRADNRDDGLVAAYLAARLGLDDPAAALMPSTATAGLKSLAYFDPPAKGTKGGKPALVGHWPCVVFATAAADGRSHAQRIYVAANGRGKADLPDDANGRARDPKKSARLAEGAPSTAGCCVVWGVADAHTIVLAEGIETTAANAHALRDETGKGEVGALSAISAAGIERFTPWPGTRVIIVAADRDEAKTGAGFKRGERAARHLAMRLAETATAVEVRIVLPGEPGTNTDFLDLLLADGVDAVRAAIAGAEPFRPTQEEIEEFRTRGKRKSELDEIIDRYPLPTLVSMTLAYRHAADGRVWLHKLKDIREDKDTHEVKETWEPISSPFRITAELRLADADNGHAMRLELADHDGAAAAIDFDRGELSRAAAGEFRGRLMHAGLRVANSGEFDVMAILKEMTPLAVITALSRSGWHRLEEWCFASPGGRIIGNSGLGRQVELFGRLANTEAGTLKGWQEAVRAAVAVKDCPHWKLGVAAGFAGALINLLGIETHGINLSGPTSLGKTTAQKLAVSAWSSPKPGAGLLQSMRTTENAVEILARQSYGTILALDELAHAAGRMIGRIIYLLAGNTGKSRMTAGGVLRPLVTWSTFVLTSGEQALEQKIRDDDGQWSSGMAVRFCNIDVAGVNAKVSNATLARIEAISQHHGHAGPAFVEKLIEKGWHRNPEPLRQLIDQEVETLAGAGADSARLRAARPLAVIAVAGATAGAFGILPKDIDIRGAVDWAWTQFAGSREAEALDSEQRALDNTRLWIAERWDTSIKKIESHTRLNGRDAAAWYDLNAIYIPTARIAEAAGNTLNAQAIGTLLDKKNLVLRRDERRIAVQWVPGVGAVRAYALKRSEFKDDPPEPPANHAKPRGYPDD
jgi:hypothetical protein